MSTTRLSFVAMALIALPTSAQDLPKPAPELEKLEVFAGSWQGNGTAKMQPGAPATKWTAMSTYQWVLGGFWLQCDTAVMFEGLGTMRMREYMGWDGENKRYVNLAIGNGGEATLAPVHLGAGELVYLVQRVKEGRPEVERVRVAFGDNQMHLTISFLGAKGGAEEGVQGNLHKISQVEVPALASAKAWGPVAPQMAKIARMAGVYEGKGEMIMAPGAPPMQIAGRDTMTVLFGGGIVMTETKGTAGMPYEAHAFHAWSPTHGCYKIYSIDSMGMICDMDGRLTDQAMICTTNGLRMGMPCVARCVVSLDKDGKPTKVINHSCMGDAPPMQDFSMTYTRSTS